MGASRKLNKQFKEGFIKTKNGKIWYKIVGKENNSIPLIVVHGGPGAPHFYLEPLEDLAEKRQVIFYDQLDCGNSERVGKKENWTPDYYVKELENVIKSLNIKKYHLLGQSWGAVLLTLFALTKPKGLKNLILSNPYLSTPLWVKDAKRLIKKMPKKHQKALKKEISSIEYKTAEKEYYYRFVTLMKKSPVAFKRNRDAFGKEVYKYMWGTNEFTLNGTLKALDLVPKLKEILFPTLLIAGKFDESTPESNKIFNRKIKNSELVVLEKSAHNSFWTERKKYMDTVNKFLDLR